MKLTGKETKHLFVEMYGCQVHYYNNQDRMCTCRHYFLTEKEAEQDPRRWNNHSSECPCQKEESGA